MGIKFMKYLKFEISIPTRKFFLSLKLANIEDN